MSSYAKMAEGAECCKRWARKRVVRDARADQYTQRRINMCASEGRSGSHRFCELKQSLAAASNPAKSRKILSGGKVVKGTTGREISAL